MAYRVTKNKKPAFLRSSSSFSKAARTKPTQLRRAATQAKDEFEDDSEERLDDLGSVSTIGNASLTGVLLALRFSKDHMFDEIPLQRTGMNSTRIAEVLNYRQNLPCIATNAHIHALINSPTLVEQEIGELVANSTIKRIVVPGRGLGASSISDALVVLSDWVDKVNASDLPSSLKQIYIQRLTASSTDISSTPLTSEEISALVQAGFFTAISGYGTSTSATSTSTKDLSATAISIHNIARSASGSMDAVGGQGAIYRIGGGGTSGLKTTNRLDEWANYKVSLPNVGTYLKLLQGAREHFLSLLSKSKYSEAPLYLLKERWDGGINTKNPYGRSKDPFKMILPGKTRKWKDFYGLNFDWVVAECLGGGLIEVFNTRSVGLGVRLT